MWVSVSTENIFYYMFDRFFFFLIGSCCNVDFSLNLKLFAQRGMEIWLLSSDGEIIFRQSHTTEMRLV